MKVGESKCTYQSEKLHRRLWKTLIHLGQATLSTLTIDQMTVCNVKKVVTCEEPTKKSIPSHFYSENLSDPVILQVRFST